MTRQFRPAPLALVALIAGCVDLTPPTPTTADGPLGDPDALVEDAEPEAGQPDAFEPDAPPGGLEPDARLDPDGPAPDVRPPDGALLANGATCSSGPACVSGVCSEGVCCNQVCNQLCRSCKISGSEGTCVAAGVGVDPRLECPAQAAATCGRAGGCDGAGACRLHAMGATCVASRCSGSTETAADLCNGQGSCVAGTSRSCAPYQCSGTACGTSCTTGSQCTSGNVCFLNGCVPSGSVPALYWSFDESSGSTAVDGSGNGLHGTYDGDSSSPPTSTDVPTLTFANPRSRAFSLVSRHGVRLSSMPAALRPANNLTVSVWYRSTRVDLDNAEDGSDLVSGGDQYMLRLTASEVQLVKRTAGAFEKCLGTTANLLDGRWHHVAGVATPGGMKVYVDGTERCSNSLGSSISYTAGPDFWVGRHGDLDTDRDFDGNIDEVRIYARALSATEVRDLALGKR